MHGEADLAAIGSLIADRTRATFLLTLLGGGLSSASALADRAGVSASLASNHLRKLTEGGLIVGERHGRHRMYRLASASIADALEALMPLAPERQEHSLRGVRARDSLRKGRLCYDHLAGRAGVVLTVAMVEQGWLIEDHGEGCRVTPDGVVGLAQVGIDVHVLAARTRPLTRQCLDWSEGRPHLAGSIGAALTAELLRRGWLEGREASRVVAVTEEGQTRLQAWLGIDRVRFELPERLERVA